MTDTKTTNRVTYLICPDCGGQLKKTTDSRQGVSESKKRKVLVIRRRKLCDQCGAKHTTFEMVGETAPSAFTPRQNEALQHPDVQALIGRLFAEGKL